MFTHSHFGPGRVRGQYLVIGDALGFVGPEQNEPLTAGFLYPNVAGRLLGLRAEIVARADWTSRDGWGAWVSDPRVGTVLADPATKAVLVALGGVDQLPAWVPFSVRESIPDVRPERVRRLVRRWYLRLGPRAIRLTGGRFRRVSQPVTDHCLSQIVRAARAQRPDVAIAAITPAGYPGAELPTRNHDAAVAACRAWAAREGVALVDIEAITQRLHSAGRSQRDGRRLDEKAHREIGAAVAHVLGQLLAGDLQGAVG